MYTFLNVHCLLLLILFFMFSCKSQIIEEGHNEVRNGIVGGPFENGEFMYIGMPKIIPSVDTSDAWSQNGQKLLITGTIYKLDGKTPAPDVILYYYHTDINGLYSGRKGLDPRVVRHGYIRGWVKSDEKGKYAIYTVRPAPYPDRDFEAHIHPSIKEPDISKEYYIDEFVFDDDKLLTGAKRKKLPNRGGSGILRTIWKGNLQIAEHNIILGLNIPNYPNSRPNEKTSGLHIGEDCPSFMPFHAFGPDKGSRACPVCKYGRYHGIIYFVGNKVNWPDIEKWLTFLEQESKNRKKYLKAYFVYGNEIEFDAIGIRKKLEILGKDLKLENIALTFVPSLNDAESEVHLQKINPELENTFIIYKLRSIVDKYIELKPTNENFRLITNRLDETRGEYFDY